MSKQRYFVIITFLLLSIYSFSKADQLNYIVQDYNDLKDYDIINKNECVTSGKHDVANNLQELVVVDSISIGRIHLHDLAWDGKNLWIIVSFPEDPDSIFKVDPSNGTVLDSFKIDIDSMRYSQGLAWDPDSPGGPFLWCSSDAHYDKPEEPGEIVKIRIKDFSVEDVFNNTDKHPDGIEWDGNILWISANFKDAIMTLNPYTRELKSLYSKSGWIEYAYQITISKYGNGKSLLWICSDDYFSDVDTVYVVDPPTGNIIQKFLNYQPSNSGICWDDGSPGGPYLWVSDWRTHMIYKIQAPVIFNNKDTIRTTFSIYPNPFIQKTTIQFYLYHPEKINLTIYNLLGYKLAVLADEYLSEGNHEFTFDGSALASGTYYYVLQANGKVESGKLILIK
ncbi:MAG: T9SS type A sorting domain-containing protein [bacterium]